MVNWSKQFIQVRDTSTHFLSRLGKILYRYWMKFAFALGVVNSHILLFIFYFILIGIYAIPRLLWRFVSGKKEKKQLSYWKEKKVVEVTIDRLMKQF